MHRLRGRRRHGEAVLQLPPGRAHGAGEFDDVAHGIKVERVTGAAGADPRGAGVNADLEEDGKIRLDLPLAEEAVERVLHGEGGLDRETLLMRVVRAKP